MKFLAFAASHRRDSINRKLVAAASCMVEAGGKAVVDFAEYADFDAPLYDDETFDAMAFPASVEQFIARLSSVEGLILSSPEYNWSFPGSLKNIIDWASVRTPNPFAQKAVLLLSASPSLRGGAQGLVQLTTPLASLGAYVYPRLFTLSCAQQAWDEEGNWKNHRLQEELQEVVAEFVQYTEALA